MTCPVINYCTLFSHIRPFLSFPHSFGLISPCSTQISRQVAAHFLTTSFLGSSWIERAIRTSNICPSITFSAVSLSTDSRFFNTKQPRCWISIFSLTTVLSKISCHWLTCFKITNPSIKFLVTTAVVERQREREMLLYYVIERERNLVDVVCVSTSRTFLQIFSLCVIMAKAPVAARTTNSSSSPQYSTINFRRSLSPSNVFTTWKNQTKHEVSGEKFLCLIIIKSLKLQRNRQILN